MTSGQERYQLLDAMRGVAALAVVWGHQVTSWSLHTFTAPEHFLAVDFFFILSGFVIGHAYGARLKHSLSPLEFLAIRVIRLHPLLIVGAIFGTISLLAQANDGLSAAILASGALAAFGLPTLLLPGPPAFPVNGPAWSLFFELIANFVYAFIARFLTPLRILALTILALVLVVMIAEGNRTIEGGWQKGGLTEGGVRVFFGFMAGLLVHEFRPRWIVSWHVGYALLFVLALILFNPFKWGVNGQLFLVVLVFPAMIWLGSAVRENTALDRAGAFLGALSYPLYILHWPLLTPLRNISRAIDPQEQWLPLWLGLQVVIAVGVAWVAMKFIDQPVRARLTRHLRAWLRPPQKIPAPQTSTT